MQGSVLHVFKIPDSSTRSAIGSCTLAATRAGRSALVRVGTRRRYPPPAGENILPQDKKGAFNQVPCWCKSASKRTRPCVSLGAQNIATEVDILHRGKAAWSARRCQSLAKTAGTPVCYLGVDRIRCPAAGRRAPCEALLHLQWWLPCCTGILISAVSSALHTIAWTLPAVSLP